MSKTTNDPMHSPESAPMEQVRELLFGAQLKDMETRFQRQEERFQREISDARDALKTRLDSLENFMKSEISSLLHRVKEETTERGETMKSEARERAESFKAEQRERSEAVAQLTKELAAANEAFERKLTKLSNTLDNTERELRQLLMNEMTSSNAKLEEKYQDALAALNKTAVEIRRDMVYRSSFSTMLTEVAVKLSGQWPLDVGAPVEPAQAEEPVKQGKQGKSS